MTEPPNESNIHRIPTPFQIFGKVAGDFRGFWITESDYSRGGFGSEYLHKAIHSWPTVANSKDPETGFIIFIFELEKGS